MFAHKVAICASTGIAATHISGTTLHAQARSREQKPPRRTALCTGGSVRQPNPTLGAQAGCGVPQRMADFHKMFSPEARQRWMQLDVLIIDEISMVSAEARAPRRPAAPPRRFAAQHACFGRPRRPA